MANVLSLALRVTADASRLKLDPVQRALVSLGDQADKLTGQFAKFAGNSEAAAKAQERFDKQAQDLINTLRDGGSATEFAAGFERLTQAANEEAAAFERAARIIEANLTPLERFDRAQAELTEQLNAGRIGQETYNRAVEGAAKGLSDAERAARGLAVQQKEIDNAAANTTLKFNELSGVFAVLPGPLGNIAGRISGLSSAGEGLSRIFAGGLSQGIGNVAASVTQLINPVTLALGGITAFGAGATAVAQGLIQLEDRVEQLGNTADKLGVSFEFIQTLEEAARRSGTSIDAVSAAFGRLQESVLGVDEESKAAQRALAEIGVTSEELAALSPDEQYNRIGRAIAGIEDPARRTAAATALFGRAGAELIPFFNNIGQAAADIDRYGRSLSELDRASVDAFGASLDALSVATQGLGQSLLLPFAGLGEGIARSLAEVTSGITAIVDPIGRILEPVFTQIGRIVQNLGQGIGNLGRVIGAVFEPFAVVVQEVFTALEPLYELFFEFAGGFGEAAVAVTEWVVSFTPIGAIAENVGVLGQTISRVVNIITTAFSRVGEFIGGLVGRFGELIAQSPLLQAIGSTISSVFGSVSSVFSTIANAIGGTVGRLLTLAENFLGIDNSAQQAAQATAELGTTIAELSEEERKAAEERDKFLAGFTANVSAAVDESVRFGQAGIDAAFQYQSAIADLQERLDRGLINEEVFRREAEAARSAYNAQIDIAKQAAAEIEANTRRVDDLLAKANEIPQIEQDLNAIESEIARVQAALADARENGATEQANALAGRLAQLDQLQAGLQDQADQAAQGFSQGFDSAFANVDKGISSLIDKASEFGNEGALAASQLQEGIAAAQEQVRDGILNREAFDAQVAQQQELFTQRLDQLQQEQAQRLQAEQAIANERQRVNQLVDEQLALAAFGGDSQRLAASRNVQAIEQEIARVQAEVAAAELANNAEAARAGTARIAQLDQVAAKERDIASGRAAREAEIAKRREEAAAREQQLVQQVAKQREQVFQQQQQVAQQQAQAQQKAFEEQAKAAAAEAERQERRIRALNSIGQQSVSVGDIRSTEGANQFIQAAAGAFDPNLAELRAQSKLLRQIAVNSGALQFLERGIGSTFQFLGGGA